MKLMTGLFILATTITSATAQLAHAGKFEVIGEGTSTVNAEFIKVDIQILAECHTTALTARERVDQLSENALQALKVFKSNIPQQLQVSPGANLQTVKSAYINNVNTVICDEDHSWTSNTIIQFRLNDLKQLASLQDTLLRLNPPKVPAAASNTERLSLSLSKPEAGVLADTWDKMSDVALQRAMQNALRQVKILTVGMNQNSIELAKVEATTNASGQTQYDRVDAEGDTAGIGLGSVSLKLARLFTYKVGP